MADLSHCLRRNLHRLPVDIDLIVGVPRSGMLVANMLALDLNLKVTDVEGFCSNRPLTPENTRSIPRSRFDTPREARHVLVIDDSVSSGQSMREVRRQVGEAGRAQRVTYCAVYSTIAAPADVDVSLEVVPDPRTFEWNILHRPLLEKFCVDIDGVLCVDPTDAQNDDGDAYLAFLATASPLALPTYRVGHLVTSRLEKYRAQTEDWLASHGVEFKHLHMLDLPDAQTRRRLGCHAQFKAQVYRECAETVLFVESEREQARKIALESGKTALCYTTQEVFQPGVTYRAVSAKSKTVVAKAKRFVARTLGR